MSETLEQVLDAWRHRPGIQCHEDGQEVESMAEDLIHMLLLEVAGKEEVIKHLEIDIQYYKSVGQLLTAHIEKATPKNGL